MEYPTERVAEGLARLEVPAVLRRRGPGKRTALPFYNPTMAVNRDLTVLALRGLGEGHLFDGLTGCGALAARVLQEAPGWRVTAADRNPLAVDLAAKNLQANGGGKSVRADLRAGVPPGDFTHIDVDPFGTPAPFLEAVLRVPTLRTISVTATDTGALCGVFPEACLRRYGIRAGRTPFAREFGTRALLAFIAQEARRTGRSIAPLLTAAAEHFLKVVVRVGSSTADGLRHLEVDDRGEWRWTEDGLGPLWSGPLGDPEFLRHLSVPAWMPHRTTVLVSRLREESTAPAFYRTTSDIGRRLRRSVLPLEVLLRALRDAGFAATRTHFAPDGFRTDANLDTVVRLGWGAPAEPHAP